MTSNNSGSTGSSGEDSNPKERLSTKRIEQKKKGSFSSLVTARGTSDGLILRLDGRAEGDQLLEAVREFLKTREEFLSGNEVELEWVGSRPPARFVAEVADVLSEEFQIRPKLGDEERELSGMEIFDADSAQGEWSGDTGLQDEAALLDSLPNDGVEEGNSSNRSRKSVRSKISSLIASEREERHRKDRQRKDRSENSKRLGKGSEDHLEDDGKTVSLFGGVESISMTQELPHGLESLEGTSGSYESGNFDSSVWDDPDARIVFSTLRSGQKVETEHSLVICGDVNSGAEVIAGGDVIVLGTLRGVAHAGAYDETGGGRFIFSLDMRPTQLRIGTVISRGSAEGGRAPEIATVEGDLIAVEPYQTKGRALRRQKVSNMS